MYPPAAIGYMATLYCFLRFVETGQAREWSYYILCFLLSVYTHEIAFSIFPVVVLIILFVTPIDIRQQGKVRLLIQTALPLALFIPIYLCINRLLLGHWIGHYGASTHLHIDLMAMVGKINLYLIKYYGFPYMWQTELYRYATLPVAVYITMGGMLIGAYIIICKVGRTQHLRYAILFLAITICTLIPVLNLYFPYPIPIMGDRLGYFAAMFAFVPVGILLSKLSIKVYWIISGVIIITSLIGLHSIVTTWQQAGNIATALDKNMPYGDAKHIYLLNVPDNYRGAYLYRCLGEGSYAMKQKMQTGQPFPAKETDILSYNLLQPNDSVTVERLSDTSLRVTLCQWGEWWWRGGLGASDYEDEWVRVDIDEWSHTYTVDFKHKLPTDAYIYQSGMRWKRVAGF